jgi:hypothetical protein
VAVFWLAIGTWLATCILLGVRYGIAQTRFVNAYELRYGIRLRPVAPIELGGRSAVRKAQLDAEYLIDSGASDDPEVVRLYQLQRRRFTQAVMGIFLGLPIAFVVGTILLAVVRPAG